MLSMRRVLGKHSGALHPLSAALTVEFVHYTKARHGTENAPGQTHQKEQKLAGSESLKVTYSNLFYASLSAWLLH